MRPAIASLALLLAASPLAAQRAAATAPLRLEDLAPADSFVFARFAGLEASSAAAEGLGLFRLWREPQVQRFLADVIGEYEAVARRTPAEIVAQWDAIERQVSGAFSVVVADVTLLWTEEGPMPTPGVVAALDVAGARAEVERSLAKVAAEGPVSVSRRTHAGHAITVLRIAADAPAFTLEYAFVGDLLVASPSGRLLDRCLDKARSGGPSLADAPGLADARVKAGADALVELYVDVDEIVSRVSGLVPLEVLDACHELGLDAIESLYYASAVHDGDSFDTLWVRAPEPRRGLLALGGEGGIDERSLAFVPETAVAVAAMDLRLAKAWDAVWAAAERVAPPEVMAEGRAEIARAESELGFRIRDGLLAALGDEFVVYAELPHDGPIPNVVASLALRDGARLGQIIGSLLAASGAEVREIEFGDYALYVFDTGQDDVPVRPTFTVMVDRLVVGLTPGSVRGALRRIEGEGGPSITATHNFRDAFRGLDWRGACALEYWDARRLVAYGMNLADAMLPSASEDAEMPFDPLLLPSEDVVLPHVNGWAEVANADSQGLLIRARSVSLATVLALAARFFDRAPGAPPFVLRTSASGGMAPRAGAPTIDVGAAPSDAPAPEPGSVVNPLRAGDPREAEVRAQIARLDRAILADPSDGALYFERALAHGRIRQFEAAIDDYGRADELGFRTPTVAYNVACSHSLLGQTEEALEWLEEALERGFDDRAILRSDSDLNAIRSTPRFDELIRRHFGG